MPLAYVICTSPRSGSTLLCAGLAHTGRAGAPAEYFDDRAEVGLHWMSRLAISEAEPYADQIIDATSSANGVFGTKVHWTTRLAMHRAFRNTAVALATQPRYPSLDDLLHLRFSAVRYIWLRRRNKVAQGISHFRAARSGLWEIPRGGRRDRSPTHDAVEFDFGFINHCVAWATRYDMEWGDYFSRHRLAPFQIFYEDLVAAYDAALREVLDVIGVPHRDLPQLLPRLERLADGDSLAWEHLYRDIEAGRATTSPGLSAWHLTELVGHEGRPRP